ncbi:sensor histidine kinase [Brachybacterium sp. UNK5269]|uniref:sensor histidine kinase n=1 Tax=Brachybacterium sp. UNK5269 TaxID=3408576 RepID=UPI003BB101E1
MSAAAAELPASPPVGSRDVLVAGGYAVLVVLLGASGAHNSGFLPAGTPWPLWFSVALMLVGCGSLLWRRRRPVITLAVAGPLSLVEIAVGGQLSAYLLLFEALFDPVMHGSRRLALLTTRIAIGATVLAVLLGLAAGAPFEMLFVVVLIAALVVLTPLLWGWEVRHHRSARQAAEQLADLEHELAASRAAHAVETERRSIAHDLHDVIAGHLSAVSLHTNLAASLPEPEGRERSLIAARASAHAALRDLRSMIGVLSTAESGSLPAVTLDWPSLTARLRGRDPEAQVSIDPAVTDPARLDPSVQAALLRIAAEATTNAVHHGLAPISLDVRVGSETVTFELHNRRAETSAPGTGVGRGTIAHRATAVGGSAGSAPADGPEAGTWRVRAQLPVRGSSPALAPTLGQEARP